VPTDRNIHNILINESHVVVLKINFSNKTAFISYEPIINPIRIELDELYCLCKKKESTLNEIKDFIIQKEELPKILSNIDYCEYLHKAYQGIESSDLNFETFFNIEENLEETLEEVSEDDINIIIQEKKDTLLNMFERRDLPYALQTTYEKCNKDVAIKAYSHRKVGWSNPEFVLGNGFILQFLTNFGYGHSSYFYSKLTFNNIDIVPFSDWIFYPLAQIEDIIRYSMKHFLHNESWLDAMNYGVDAINLYQLDERKFIEKYIFNECKDMVKGLEFIVENHIFSFKQYNGTFKEYEFNDKRKLIKYRGEKISGALIFIDSILNFKGIIIIEDFISRIEKLNRIIQPILKKELSIIKIEIKDNSNEIIQFEPEYNILYRKYNLYTRFKNRINKIVNPKNDDNSSDGKVDIELFFSERYPQYYEVINKFYEVSKVYHKLRQLGTELENYSKDFTDFIERVDDYFNTKSGF